MDPMVIGLLAMRNPLYRLSRERCCIHSVGVGEDAGVGIDFGFQAQEGGDEWSGEGNVLAFKYWVHDARLGRCLSIDPLTPEYSWNSPCAFSENRVIDAIELEGLEKFIILHSPMGTKAVLKLLSTYEMEGLSQKAVRIELERKIGYWLRNEFVDDSQSPSDYASRKMSNSKKEVLMNNANFAASYYDFGQNGNIYIIGTLWVDEKKHNDGGTQGIVFKITRVDDDNEDEAWRVIVYRTPRNPWYRPAPRNPRSPKYDGQPLPPESGNWWENYRPTLDADYLYKEHGVLPEDLVLDPASDTVVPVGVKYWIMRKDDIIVGVSKDQMEKIESNPSNKKYYETRGK